MHLRAAFTAALLIAAAMLLLAQPSQAIRYSRSSHLRSRTAHRIRLPSRFSYRRRWHSRLSRRIRLPSRYAHRMSLSSQHSLKSMFLQKLAVNRASVPRGSVCSHCLLTSPRHSGYAVKGSGSLQQMDATLRSRGIPHSVRARMKVIAFSQSTKFKIFNFNVKSSRGSSYYNSYLAAARKLSRNRIEFGVVRGYASARIVRKYRKIRYKKCRKILFFRRCKKRTKYVPRGNYASELKQIEQALRAFAQNSQRSQVLRHF